MGLEWKEMPIDDCERYIATKEYYGTVFKFIVMKINKFWNYWVQQTVDGVCTPMLNGVAWTKEDAMCVAEEQCAIVFDAANRKNMGFKIWIYKEELDRWELEKICSREEDANECAEKLNKEGINTKIEVGKE